VLLASGHQLDSSKLIAKDKVSKVSTILKDGASLPTVLESRDDWANESTLNIQLIFSPRLHIDLAIAYLDAIRLNSNKAVEIVSFTAIIIFSWPETGYLRLLVRHNVVVESGSFFSLICRCS
jgi:hypothetical protein